VAVPSISTNDIIDCTNSDVSATSTNANHTDITRPEAKTWPRLHLLGLPRKLHDHIYTYAIVSDPPICIAMGDAGRRDISFDSIPSLPKVCHQLRHETRHMFLKENAVHVFHWRNNAASWLSKPSRTFRALCVDTELQRLMVEILRCPMDDDDFLHFIISETKTGVKISKPPIRTTDDCEVRACYIKYWIDEDADRKGVIVHKLEAFRHEFVDDGQPLSDCSW